ncbi:MAG: HEAT repeat domain-containing protein [Acidobacteriota bacterium]|nr:HEAT repeat domain-containing protein [Acidobacteriota bacterium]
MSDEKLQSVRNLLEEFGDLSLSDFRDAFQGLVGDKNPTVDRYLLEEMKNFRGNRSMRAVIAHALAEREDEAYIEDFALIIEKETDVSLCKECILGLAKIGTPAAIQKLDFLAKSKPNATISSLLRKELDKIRHEEKEPVAYYLDHLARGNANARNCIHASKVLLKIGDVKVVDTILEAFPGYDELARSEGAKVISQLGETRHLVNVLDLLDQYKMVYEDNLLFTENLEILEQTPKEERIALLLSNLKKRLPNDFQPDYDSFKSALEAQDLDECNRIIEQWIELKPPLGTRYYAESMVMIVDNKVAHAGKHHEEAARGCRIRHSRLRHLVAQLAYGVGKITGQREEDDALRARSVDRLTGLVNHKDNDISKQALYGTSFMVRPEDEILLDATLSSPNLEGMTRLLRTLERNQNAFTDFFLRVAMEHEILDIQEMAMQALGKTQEVYDKVRKMLESDKPDTKRTAIRIIGEIKADVFRQDLLDLLTGQSDIIRIQAIKSLGHLGDPTVLDSVNEVMYDAKSPVLIEACLEAIATIGGDAGIHRLHQFIERTRNKKNAVTAVRLLVESYRHWNNPLPEESCQLALDNIKPWFEERDDAIRKDAYHIAAAIICDDLNIYKTLKALFKDASSKLRGQQSWDKTEMNLVNDKVKVVNRNFFFLQDMLEFNKEIKSRTRNHDHDGSSTRVNVFEKLLKMLDENDRFVISQENETLLGEVALKGLELAGDSWREQGLCFKIAGYATGDKLKENLCGRVKTVPKQAKSELLDALTKLGMGLKEINDLTSIRKILVLEGSGFYRKRVCKYLRGKDYDVRDSDDPEMGLAMIQSNKPDLVITEIMFGDGNSGLDLVEKIAGQYGDAIQVIFSTNAREVSVMERAVKLRPMKIFHKPYPLDDLDAVIKG